MASAKDFMRQAHANRENTATKEAPPTLTPSPVVTNSKPEPTTPRPEAPPPQRKAKVLVTPAGFDDMPTSVKQIARHDVPVEHYGVSSYQSNFGVFDKEMLKWLTEFSKENKMNGGCSITKSQLIHIIMDVAFYDLDISPIGFESHQELREHIQNQILGR